VRSLPEETALITGAADQTEKLSVRDNAGAPTTHSHGTEAPGNGADLDVDVDERVEPLPSKFDEPQLPWIDGNSVATAAREDDEAIVDFDDLEPEEAARLLKTFDPIKLRKEPEQSRSTDPNHQSGRDGTQ
jgi:hypothetical protein